MGTTTETRITSTQAKDAIYKAHSISSSASEIDDATKKITSGDITMNDLSFLKLGKNKFNKSTATSGYYMALTGTPAASATYGYSDYIAVNATESYATNNFLRFITFYDSQKVALAAYGLQSISSTFTIPTNAKFMIVTFTLFNIDVQQVELGSISTAYSDYFYTYVDAPIREQVETPTDYYLAIAPKYYFCQGKESVLYHENIARNFKQYSGQIGIDLGIDSYRYSDTSVSTKLSTTTGLAIGTSFSTGTAKIVDDSYSTLVNKQFNFEIADMSKSTAITVANIGDSYSGRMTWANVILGETTPSQNLNFVGIRNANTAPIKCDAQGGWTLKLFFTVNGGGAFSQFMHPVSSGYLYYGTTSFWIDANSASPSYNAADFTTTKTLFNSTTGLKITPNVGDVMYNGTSYINWNGSAWVTVAESSFGGFAFNYAKYRQAWNIPAVNLLHVLLGTNDFSSVTSTTFEAQYTEFKTRYNSLIASVKADLPSCNIAIGIPVSSGKQGKHGTILSETRKLGYWLLAKSLIRDYGNREVEGIYLVDYHAQVDRVYGYDNTQNKPFLSYDGTFRDDENLNKTDIVHLGLEGFEQMGLPYMALIQKLR